VGPQRNPPLKIQLGHLRVYKKTPKGEYPPKKEGGTKIKCPKTR